MPLSIQQLCGMCSNENSHINITTMWKIPTLAMNSNINMPNVPPCTAYFKGKRGTNNRHIALLSVPTNALIRNGSSKIYPFGGKDHNTSIKVLNMFIYTANELSPMSHAIYIAGFFEGSPNSSVELTKGGGLGVQPPAAERFLIFY